MYRVVLFLIYEFYSIFSFPTIISRFDEMHTYKSTITLMCYIDMCFFKIKIARLLIVGTISPINICFIFNRF